MLAYIVLDLLRDSKRPDLRLHMRLAFALYVGLLKKSHVRPAATLLQISPAIREVVHQNSGYEYDVCAVSLFDHERERVRV